MDTTVLVSLRANVIESSLQETLIHMLLCVLMGTGEK